MSDALARPSLFILKGRYSKVYCQELNYEDLWAEIRTNLSHDERRDFLEASNAIRNRVQEYLESRLDRAKELDDTCLAATDRKTKLVAGANRRKFLDEQDSGVAAMRMDRLSLAAPFIRAWNIGNEIGDPVPPPIESGAIAFDYTDDVIVTWLLAEVERGYRGGFGVRTRLNVSESTPPPTSGPQLVTETDTTT